MAATWKLEYAGTSGIATVPNERRYTKRGRVVTDSAYTIPEVSLVSGVPRKFDPFGPEDLGAKLVKLGIKPDPDNQLIWQVSAEYSSHYGNEQQDNQPNPLLRPAIWRYQSVRGTRTQEVDAQGNVYENAAGDPFTSPPEIVFSTARYTVTRNEISFSGANADNYANTVNSGAWYDKATRTVLLEGIAADERYEGEYHFFTVTYTLHVDRNGWQPVKVPNKGYRYKDSQGDFHLPEPAVLIWLQEDGDQWGPFDPESEKYIDYYPFDERNFAALEL